MTLMVQVLTPGGVVWDAIAQEVILPSIGGQMGVLTGHISLTTYIDSGIMRIRSDRHWTAIAVMNGFAQIGSDEVIVLVNSAERGDQIDLDLARADLQTAEERMSLAESRQEWHQATQAVQRAKARLGAALVA